MRLPGPRARARLIPSLIVLAILVAAVLIERLFMSSGTDEARLSRLRQEIRAARVEADSCMAVLRSEDARFQAFDRRVDSLRESVRTYESMDTAGVPAEEYERYLDAFDAYNEAVPVWRERADSLRARSARCRTLVEHHNLLADSLRPLIEDVRAEP